MKKLIIILFVIVILFAKCSFPSNDFTNEGEKISVIQKNQAQYDCELFSVSSNTLYCMLDTLIEIKFKDIQKISIDRLSGNTMLTHGILFQIAPAILISVAAAIAKAEVLPVLLITSIPGLLTILISTSTAVPDIEYVPPFDENKINELRKYCRYYQTLSDDQIKTLIQNQKKTQKIIDANRK
jgi:hypothetical protein